MNQTGTSVQQQKSDATVARIDMKLEVDVIPVSDVERSKLFYRRLGWRLDFDDAAPSNGVRIVQFTPPGFSVLGHVRQGNNCGCPWLGCQISPVGSHSFLLDRGPLSSRRAYRSPVCFPSS